MTDLIQLRQQLHDYSVDGNLLIIDADSIAYMIGWHHRESEDEFAVSNATVQFVKDLLLITHAKGYVGWLSSDSEMPLYRAERYKYKPYKGKRAEKADWVVKWQPVIDSVLINEFKFKRSIAGAESDDMVSLTAWYLRNSEIKHVICSPDKDMQQIPGLHLNYKKQDETTGQFFTQQIDVTEAHYNWCYQMLIGDETDNIAGVPKMGPKKAEALLKDLPEAMWSNAVRLEYEKYFNAHYGGIIHDETAIAVTMCIPGTPIFEGLYGPWLPDGDVELELLKNIQPVI